MLELQRGRAMTRLGEFSCSSLDLSEMCKAYLGTRLMNAAKHSWPKGSGSQLEQATIRQPDTMRFTLGSYHYTTGIQLLLFFIPTCLIPYIVRSPEFVMSQRARSWKCIN